jgi:hypothetical protein
MGDEFFLSIFLFVFKYFLIIYKWRLVLVWVLWTFLWTAVTSQLALACWVQKSFVLW